MSKKKAISLGLKTAQNPTTFAGLISTFLKIIIGTCIFMLIVSPLFIWMYGFDLKMISFFAIIIVVLIVIGLFIFIEPSESKIDKSKFSKVDGKQIKKELELAKEEKRRKEELYLKKVEGIISSLDDDSFDILYRFDFIDESWSKEQVINHFLLSMSIQNLRRLIQIVKKGPYRDVHYNKSHDEDNLNNSYDSDNNNYFRAQNEISHEKLLDVFLDETKLWKDENKVDVYNKQDLIDYFQQNYTGNEIYQLFKRSI